MASKCLLVLSTLVAIGTLSVATAASAATLGTTLPQPSFETAGLIVRLTGDDGNETVTVDVKGPADADYRPAHVTTRFEPHAVATSLFGLKADTEYAVRVTLVDPDGVSGAATQELTVHTRAEAALPLPVRVRWVGPGGQDSDASGATKGAPYATPTYALQHAQPGDEVRVLAGTYAAVSVSALHATDAAPVVLRADDPNVKPIIDGEGAGNAFAVDDTSYLVVDGFEVRNGGADDSGHGVYLRASSHVTVRNCYVHDNGHDDFLVSKGAEFSGGVLLGGFHLIEDNEIADVDQDSCEGGSNTACPRQTYYGIKQDNNPGAGTVVRRNYIHGHDDNMSPCGDENVGRDLAEGQPVLALVGSGTWTNHDLEIYDNKIEAARDDGIEVDGICVNARIYRNTITGAQNVFSAAPALPGPYFFVRNVATGTIGEAFFKINTSGNSAVATRNVFVYHNTFVRATAGTLLNLWFAVEGDHNVPIHDLAFKNNVLSAPLGGTCTNVNNHGTEQPSFDGDVWFTTDTTGMFAWWNGATTDKYDSFAAWQTGAHVEPAGTFGDPGLDASLHPVATSLVVDRAVAIAGINDVFVGAAPDVGAVELGAPDPSTSSSGGTSGTSGSSGTSGASGATASGGEASSGATQVDAGADSGGCGCTTHDSSSTSGLAGLGLLAFLGVRRGRSSRRP